MAYSLLYNGSRYAHSATLGNLLTASKIRVQSEDFRFFVGGNGGHWFSQRGITTSASELGVYSDGQLRIFFGGQNTIILTAAETNAVFNASGWVESDLFEIELDVINSTYAIRSDNATIKTGSFSKGTGRNDGVLFRLGARSTSDVAGNTSGAYISPAGSRTGNTKVWIDDVLVRDYVSTGEGATWPELVSSSNGTVVGAAVDNSHWGFYESSPTDDVDSSIAATWPSLAVSVSQSQELPAGTTADIALTWPSLSVAANQTSMVPEYSSTVATTWPSLGVNASQSATVPEYATSVNAVWPSLSVSISQGQAIPAVDSSVNVTWPSLSVLASQAQSIPSVSTDISATWPSLTIAADQTQQLPAGATSVSVTWPSLSVSASQSATVPTTTADISATWPSLSVSAGIDVSVPVGGASVAVTWPSLAVSVSQSATAPTLSQINVTWPSLTASAEQASTVPEYAATISTTWPSLAVSVIAGEFDYATDPNAKITINKESRRVTISQPSRKITIVTPSRRIEL